MTTPGNGPTDPRAAPGFGTGYLAGELARTLRAAAAHTDAGLRQRAQARAQRLIETIEHLFTGKTRVGDRQPHVDMPAWATPEVVRGGFASGQAAAGGDWRPHELALAARLGAASGGARTRLNGHHLTREGLDELHGQLASREYRIDVPEEAALLVMRWLMARGEHAIAATLIEHIEPFFDRMRFYPRPADTPLPPPSTGIDAPVLARSVHSVAEGLERKQPSKEVESMREHYEVWAPLKDELVTLMLDTVEGPVPHFAGEGPERCPAGGLPFTRLPSDFEERRVELLRRIAAARQRHRRCQRVHRQNEVLGLFTAALTAWPALDAAGRAQWAARVRHRLAGFIDARGVPGSDRHRAMRARQAVGPSHARIAGVLAARLKSLAEPGAGLTPAIAAMAARPIVMEEQLAAVPAGTPVPAQLLARLQAAEEAPLAALIERRAIRSSEALAVLLPQLSGPALATRFTDPAARALHAASYQAFRRRRSLLLLWLQHQVRFSELPWIASLEACADADAAPAAKDTLRQFAAFAIQAFPATVTPNKLVSELAALARIAVPAGDAAKAADGVAESPGLPLVEELASDIFMGTFSLKFVQAARVAARLLKSLPGGSLYARYYGIDVDRVLSLQRVEGRWGTKTCPDFDAYCLELAALPAGGNSRARNGSMIEQASILTTHNLAVLVDGLQLEPLLSQQWEALAERTFLAVLDRLERRVIPRTIPRIQRMRASKTLAFGWRQMVFFMAFLAPASQLAFTRRCRELLAARTPAARQRFAPVLAGLERAASGGLMPREASRHEVDRCRRLLGWSLETPFLMGEIGGPPPTR